MCSNIYIGGRPSKKAKYEFTSLDKLAVENYIEKHLPETGMDYSAVVEMYFKDKDPSVSPKDVNNLVHHSPHLKSMLASGMLILFSIDCYLIKLAHKKIKDAKKAQFDREVSKMKTRNKINEHTRSEPIEVETMQELVIDEALVFVKFESEKNYGWVLRHDLGK